MRIYDNETYAKPSSHMPFLLKTYKNVQFSYYILSLVKFFP